METSFYQILAMNHPDLYERYAKSKRMKRNQLRKRRKPRPQSQKNQLKRFSAKKALRGLRVNQILTSSDIHKIYKEGGFKLPWFTAVSYLSAGLGSQDLKLKKVGHGRGKRPARYKIVPR